MQADMQADLGGQQVLTLEYRFFVRPRHAAILLVDPHPVPAPVLLEMVDDHSDDSEESIFVNR